MIHRRNLMLGAGALATAPGAVAGGVTPLVVLELFTSQGCSSCPPADALLTEMSPRPGVVALAWHVDYWNRLGWPDPFASSAWTDRQRRYAQRLNAEVYTPALVINGTHMVVGSDRGAVRSAMAAAAAPAVATTLQRADGGVIARVGPRPDGAMVTLVTYDPEHATPVRGGENSGRTLRESHIVRTAAPVTIGSEAMTLGPVTPQQGAVLLVQSADLAILGAAQVRAVGEAGA
ncbi:MAG: DUF1223 domain-containing protein [Acetobacteraceae bacterium]